MKSKKKLFLGVCATAVLTAAVISGVKILSGTGVFSLIKLFGQKGEKTRAYLEMSPAELKELSDEELIEAVTDRLFYEEGDNMPEESLKLFSAAKRVFYVVNYFDMEVQNGGIGQFFENSSVACAPYLSDSLGETGALSYKELFDKFIAENGIDPENPGSFDYNDEKEYEELNEKYHLDDFDEEYMALYEEEGLDTFLAAFVRENINEF